MKSLFVFVTVFLSMAAAAQDHISTNQSISDDGKNLSIKIKGTINDKPIDYNKTFDITGMTKEQKDALKKSVYDSLGLPLPVPRAPLRPRVPVELSQPVAQAVPVVSWRSEFAESYFYGHERPFTKEIKYNPATGILSMKYRFIKNGEQVSVEKSVDAKDKSKEELGQIIKKYEKEIGFWQPEAV